MATIPILPWPYQSRTYTDIQPFTERDGLTFIRTLAELEQYMRLVVTHLDGQYALLVTDWNNIVGELSDKVNASVANGQTLTDTKIAELQAAFDIVVQQILNDSIELQDVVLKAILENPESASGEYARELFASQAMLQAQRDQINLKISEDIAAGRTSVESWANGQFADKATQTVVSEGRLSSASVVDQLNVHAVKVGGAFPRLRKPLNAPVFLRSASTAASLYWPWLVDNTVGGGVGWSLYYSTDHATPHATSGIYRADAPTPFGPFVDRGRVFRDDVLGFQTETPCVWWEARVSRWYMTYQQAGVGLGNQTTLWASSADGITWVREGILAEYIYGTPGDGHTGYWRRFKLAGSEYAYSLYGGADFSKQALWYRDNSAGPNQWFVDPRQICSGVEMMPDIAGPLIGAPTTDPNDPAIGSTANILWKAIGGGVIEWRGRAWWIGTVGPHGAGVAGTFDQMCVAPLRADLLGIAEQPVTVTPPTQAWENNSASTSGNVFEYQGRTYMAYGTGKQGDIGIMEIY